MPNQLSNLKAKRYKCDISSNYDLYVDVEYQDDLVAIAFIRMMDTQLGYATINVFKGDQYIGPTGIVIRYEDRYLTSDDYSKLALPSITTAVEQLLSTKQTTREFEALATKPTME